MLSMKSSNTYLFSSILSHNLLISFYILNSQFVLEMKLNSFFFFNYCFYFFIWLMFCSLIFSFFSFWTWGKKSITIATPYLKFFQFYWKMHFLLALYNGLFSGERHCVGLRVKKDSIFNFKITKNPNWSLEF